MTIDECFQLLDLNSNATLEELKIARKELLQVWHPDKFPPDSKLAQRALEKSKQINDAYDKLVIYLKTGQYKQPSQPKKEQTKQHTKTTDYAIDYSAKAQKMKDEVAEEFRQYAERARSREARKQAEKERAATEKAERKAQEKRIAQKRTEREHFERERAAQNRVERERLEQQKYKELRQKEANNLAAKQIGKSILLAIIAYPIAGVGGCLIRGGNEVQRGNIHQEIFTQLQCSLGIAKLS